jgi:hypothetical protein
VPSPRHRTAIEGAAIVRSVSEPLLAALLAPSPAPRAATAPVAPDALEGAPEVDEADAPPTPSQELPADAQPDDVHAVFDWLRNQNTVG